MSRFPRLILCITLTVGLLSSCGKDGKEAAHKTAKSAMAEYPDHVGDIAPDPELDNLDFKTCSKGKIPQYYALGADYRVANKVLMDHFGTVTLPDNTPKGYYTIRFVVNCEGRIGRLREQSMNTDYQEMEFRKDLKATIRTRLLAFDQWPQGRDFYQYLTFKIEGGKISEVLP